MVKLVLGDGIWLVFVVFSMYVCFVSLSLVMKTNDNFLIRAVIECFVSFFVKLENIIFFGLVNLMAFCKNV